MSFINRNADLPVSEIIPELKQALDHHPIVILTAQPGAGKSTLLPLVLKDEAWLGGRKIKMLEPRRLAARAVAERMAEMLGEECGQTVGYRVRFENRVSEKTTIEVLTEGILTRMLQNDNSLDDTGLVIFDEFHERSIHADLALALCREAQQILRPDLRILIMSATIDTAGLTEKLRAPLISSAGQSFPVEIRYGSDADEQMLPELTARQVLTASREETGDILVFLPGEAEIRRCAELLEADLPGVTVMPLYGQLPPAQQRRALFPDATGRRKVVLATSIAETSLTIEGIRVVIDTGFTRKLQFDPGAGLSKLVTVRVTADAADQRTGRAGRTQSGVCYRMWGLATQQRLGAVRIPEILEADLSPLVLELAAWGIHRPDELSWIDPPPAAGIAQSRQLLEELEAVSGRQITPHGRKMLKMPCHPRLAHMLINAGIDDMKALACDIAAVLEERDPLGREAGADINLRIEKLRRIRASKPEGEGRWRNIIRSAAAFSRLLNSSTRNDVFDATDTGLLLSMAYPERIASARPGNNAQFQLANGRLAMIPHDDALAHEPWLAVAHLNMREGMGRIFLAAPLNPSDLAARVREQEVIVWDSRKGGLITSRDLRLGNLVLRSVPLSSPDPEKILRVLLDALRQEGSSLLNWDEEVTSLQNRIESLRLWNQDEDWPDISTEALLNQVEHWFTAPVERMKKNEDLKKVQLRPMIEQWLGWERMNRLDQLAPEKIRVPSGSMIRIAYGSGGEPPVLSVRLQELFGLADTPRINEGRTPLLLHLLSPGYKPVQVTTDLHSFWNNTYFEVRKELRRRYPKHAWPDDPWNALPVAKGRSAR